MIDLRFKFHPKKENIHCSIAKLGQYIAVVIKIMLAIKFWLLQNSKSRAGLVDVHQIT